MIADGPAARARYWLCDYWDEPDSYVAKLADCSKTTVLRVRHELERLGVIPHREPDLSEDAWRPGPTWHSRGLGAGLTPRQRALIEVEADPGASDQRISERAGCSRTTVREARRELERQGEIEAIPAAERERRTQLGQAQDDWQWPEMPPRPEIMARGLCVVGGHDPDLWTSRVLADRAKAIMICQACEARGPCLDWAVEAIPVKESAVIYGGVSAHQRIKIRRQRKAQAAVAAGQ
jgi:DNA-binding Lrp family transcriptional regulator